MNSDFAGSESFICVNKFDICQYTCHLSRQSRYSVALRGKCDLKCRSMVRTPKFSLWIVSFCSLLLLFSSPTECMMNTRMLLHTAWPYFTFLEHYNQWVLSSYRYTWLVFYSNLYKNNYIYDITSRHIRMRCSPAPCLPAGPATQSCSWFTAGLLLLLKTATWC